MLFDQIEVAAGRLQQILGRFDPVDEGHRYSWPNFVYRDRTFRRAHLDIVDARATKKLYMMHLCVFPHVHDPAPIYGFDIIAGASKVTGAFHDFSPVAPHSLLTWFADTVSGYAWSRERELPDWARSIFSGHMVAAGNITDPAELATVLKLAENNLLHYLDHIGEQSSADYTQAQNFYCANQKRNPHTPRVMAALGLDAYEVDDFIKTCLFPEIAGDAG